MTGFQTYASVIGLFSTTGSSPGVIRQRACNGLNWRSFVFCISALCLSALPFSAPATEFCNQDIDQVKVESSKSVDEVPFHRMDLAAFNNIIAEVPARSESWIMDPVRVVLEYLGTSGARAVTIRRCDVAGELASETAVRILEDGYADDSARGTWYHFILTRDAEQRWTIKQGREAYRCWRGHHKESYSEQTCS